MSTTTDPRLESGERVGWGSGVGGFRQEAQQAGASGQVSVVVTALRILGRFLVSRTASSSSSLYFMVFYA